MSTAPIHPPVPDCGSQTIVVPRLMHRYKPKAVIDYGCNDGKWLIEFNRLGILWMNLMGIDVPGMRLHFKGHPLSFMESGHDDTKYCPTNNNETMVLCLEVLEHVTPQEGDAIIKRICDDLHPGRIVFSAAIPGQGGWGHINEQPHSHWIQKIEAKGYFADTIIREHLCYPDANRKFVSSWYKNNLIVFSR